MKLEDIAKITIDEVAAELEKIQKLEEMQRADETPKTDDIIVIEETNTNEPKPNLDLKDEQIFLQNLKDRISVLFEGLNNTKQDNIALRLELTTKFLEFLLANIEHRLSNISK
ncbi:hypothetical protein CIG11343_0894 [Campylobacter iguaniorum]|uniref:CiaD-like domain-containing protein n=1 Tax=Campylobacter iguaniorum TaxID=1244531 RepID=UPI0007C960F6|nr:hypothetical protein [Campylobacter iguaniorum]ANE35921.1 hypothetical protein CIG11343_0894 [Campylobacter iguaniorum]